MVSLAEELRTVLLDPAEAVQLQVVGRTCAAVLIPLFAVDADVFGVFTERRPDLRRHAGEISFPGGRQDPGEPLQATALREAQEEIGLSPDAVEIVGALPPTPTVATDYSVYPFVGVIAPGLAWRLSPHEVAAVLELSLSQLRAGFGRRRMLRRGIPFATDVYVVDDHLIWGATARILGGLLGRLAPLLDRQPR